MESSVTVIGMVFVCLGDQYIQNGNIFDMPLAKGGSIHMTSR